jgi:hypothetical protein
MVHVTTEDLRSPNPGGENTQEKERERERNRGRDRERHTERQRKRELSKPTAHLQPRVVDSLLDRHEFFPVMLEKCLHLSVLSLIHEQYA